MLAPLSKINQLRTIAQDWPGTLDYYDEGIIREEGKQIIPIPVASS